MKRIVCAVLTGLMCGFAPGAYTANIDDTSVSARLNDFCDVKVFVSKTDDPDLKTFASGKLDGQDVSDCDLSDPSWNRFAAYEVGGYRTRWLLDRVLLLDGIDRLQAASNRADPTAQALLGYAKREGRGVTKDVEGAISLLSRACEAENPQGCLETVYSEYWGRGAPQDVAAALVGFKGLCDQGMGTACDRAGYIISRGEGGVETDLVQANIYFTKACENYSGNGCTKLAHSYKNGTGSPVYEAKAIDTYYRGCRLWEGYACSQLWDTVLATTDETDFFSLQAYMPSLELGCSLGSGSSCFKIGDIYNKGRYGTTRNETIAYYAMAQACKFGQSNGCYNQGSWLISGRGVEADSRKAIEVLRPLCERERPDYQACNNAGSAAYRGIGMAGPDYQLAADFYRKACYFSGMPAACSSMIDMLEDGETQPLQANELSVLRAKMAE